MAALEKTRMLNGRVNVRSANRATKILRQNGLSVSSFIRNSIDFISRTGEVPACGFPPAQTATNKEALKHLIADIEKTPMPGKAPYVGLSTDELYDRIRMERYGY